MNKQLIDAMTNFTDQFARYIDNEHWQLECDPSMDPLARMERADVLDRMVEATEALTEELRSSRLTERLKRNRLINTGD